VTAHDCLDATGFIVEGIEDGEKAFAGHAEDAFDAVSEERIDDQSCARGGEAMRRRDSRCHTMKSPGRFARDANGHLIS
jgi:hypothetical protein